MNILGSEIISLFTAPKGWLTGRQAAHCSSRAASPARAPWKGLGRRVVFLLEALTAVLDGRVPSQPAYGNDTGRDDTGGGRGRVTGVGMESNMMINNIQELPLFHILTAVNLLLPHSALYDTYHKRV